MKNKVKIILGTILAACVGLAVYAQSGRIGFTTISVGGSYYPYGQTVVVSAASTNCTNIAIIPNDSPVTSPYPGILGAVPQVTFLDALIKTAGQNSTPIENVIFFYSTNISSVFAGDDAAVNLKALQAGANTTNTYGTNTAGAGTNAYWLDGVVPGLLNNQWVVVKHAQVSPLRNAYEPALVLGTNVVTWTNSFTNGANQVTSTISTNTVVTLQLPAGAGSASNGSSLRYTVNSGDTMFFETTNNTMIINTNSPLASSRLTLSDASGVISGDRGQPLMIELRGTNGVLTVTANLIP